MPGASCTLKLAQDLLSTEGTDRGLQPVPTLKSFREKCHAATSDALPPGIWDDPAGNDAPSDHLEVILSVGPRNV